MSRGTWWQMAMLATLSACSSPRTPGGSTTSCGSEQRKTLSCESEVVYQGVTTVGGVSVLNVAGAEAKYQELAIRRINAEVEKYVAAQRRLCEEYNRCVVDGETYHAEASKLRDRLTGLGHAIERFRTPGLSHGKKKRALATAYEKVVPATARDEQVSVKLAAFVKLPPELAGSRKTTFLLRPNEPLPTGARVHFTVNVDDDAHVYLVQRGVKSGVSLLFPLPKIALDNPLSGGKTVRIPPGDRDFVLNDEDVGTEWLYVVASRQPVARMDALVKKLAAGEIASTSGSPVLANLTKLAPGTPPDDCQERALELAPASDCIQSRGLVLEGEDESLAVKTDPGDSVIVKAFPYRHFRAADYAAALKRFESPEGQDERGLVVED